MLKNKNCGTCGHWEVNEELKGRDGMRVGECRAYPPQHVSNIGWAFPVTAENRECGCYKERGIAGGSTIVQLQR